MVIKPTQSLVRLRQASVNKRPLELCRIRPRRHEPRFPFLRLRQDKARGHRTFTAAWKGMSATVTAPSLRTYGAQT
jgi:hypothetical protein